tara:strand:- start:7 stop:153 length:147 start_codon:yes stop_codon:yes gene_type:complete
LGSKRTFFQVRFLKQFMRRWRMPFLSLYTKDRDPYGEKPLFRGFDNAW